ncbi:MAG: antitoxin VapB family protein [Thaumarchaeota archaeon]|nr:antitoxin VapB family protein [Nitrososphaerota archaeon]
MGTTTISLSNEAYRILKSQKKEGESFSDLILRKFGKGNPSAMLAYLKESSANEDLADAIEKASKETRRNLKLHKVDL